MMLLTIFKGKARIFLFLGFFAASFLQLNTIAIAAIFAGVAILVVGFTADDFAAFHKTEKTNTTAYKLLKKDDLRRMWLRWEYYCESCYNYENMQGLGFTNAMVTGVSPSLEEVRTAKKYAGTFPVIVGSGVKAATAKDYLSIADGAIVGSSFKKHGNVMNVIDSRRVAEFMKAIA